MSRTTREVGYALITALLMIAILSAILGVYMNLVTSEQASTKAEMDRVRGFYAAEAGVNLRAAAIRQIYKSYNNPAGTPPANPALGKLPCVAAETGLGTGDFACISYPFSNREARTYVREEAGNPTTGPIPPGERYAGLTATEWRFMVSSTAVSAESMPEALIDMRWKTRSVPVFQFLAFYNGDLEFHPGPIMNVHGPIHTNGNLYLHTDGPSGGTGLHIFDTSIAVAGRLLSGMKQPNNCNIPAANVRIDSNGLPSSPLSPPAGANDTEILLPQCTAAVKPFEITQAWLDSNGLGSVVETGVDAVEIPPIESFDPPQPLSAHGAYTTAGGLYWQNADLRLVLTYVDLDGDGTRGNDESINNVSEATVGVDLNYDGDLTDTVSAVRERWVEVRNANNTINVAATRVLNDPNNAACAGQWGTGDDEPRAVSYSNWNTYNDNVWKWRDGAAYISPVIGLQDWREVNYFTGAQWIHLLEVDLTRLLNCVHSSQASGIVFHDSNRALNDVTTGGLIYYLTVDGPNSTAARSNYGVRIKNAANIASTVVGAPLVDSLSIVTDQAAYIQGNFNLDAPRWIPAAVFADTLSILSSGWSDSYSNLSTLSSRVASNTTVQAAFLAGIKPAVVGGVRSGGLHNYPRFLETWSSRTLTLRTSFVSLAAPRHNDSAFVCCPHYSPPGRNWDFDQRFLDANNLPPMTPRFTYNRQEMYARRFEW